MSFAMRRAAPHVGRVEGGFDIEARLAELARARGPLRRVFAAVAGAMLERRGYERLGYARVGDYARERLGLSGRVLQELAQVDAKLAGLPRLEQALVAGALPWSKVRLLTRFVTADDEERWIVFARDHSCRVLEKRLRSVDRGALGGVESTEEADGVGKTETVRLRVPMKAAFKWHRTCRDAAKVAGVRFTLAIVLEMVTG